MSHKNITAIITVFQDANGTVVIEGQFKNTSTTEIAQLNKLDTPMAGNQFFKHFVEVTKNPGKPNATVLPYDTFASRSRPAYASDIVTLQPGKLTKHWYFRLSDVMVFDETAEYSVTLKLALSHVPNPADKTSSKADLLPFEISATAPTLTVKAHNLPTIHQAFIKLGKYFVPYETSETHMLTSKALPPQFEATSTDTAKKDELAAAHYAAYEMIEDALRFFNEERMLQYDEKLRKWFGTFDPWNKKEDRSAMNAIRSSFLKMQWHMENKPIKYDFMHPKKDREASAFVKGLGADWDGTIYLAKGFWNPKCGVIGWNSKAGTIIHELAHGVDMAVDIAKVWYGVNASKYLSMISKTLSSMHADSLCYFCEGTNPFSGQWIDEAGNAYRISEVGDQRYQVTLKDVTGEDGAIMGLATTQYSIDKRAFELFVMQSDGMPTGTLNQDHNKIEWDDKSRVPWLKLDPKLVYAPKGIAIYGSPKDEVARAPDEFEQSIAWVERGFFINSLLTTCTEFEDHMPNSKRSKGDHIYMPRREVSWNDAKAYCVARTQSEHAAGLLPNNWKYCLPNGLQWEYAARAGTFTAFWYGDDYPDSGYPLLKQHEEHPPFDKKVLTRPVGWGDANPWGLRDIHGNLSEWCDDYFSGVRPADSDLNLSLNKPVRGGSTAKSAANCRISAASTSTVAREDIGFRVVLVWNG